MSRRAARHQLACYRHAIGQAKSWLDRLGRVVLAGGIATQAVEYFAGAVGPSSAPFAARAFEVRQARYWLRTAGVHLSRARSLARAARRR